MSDNVIQTSFSAGELSPNLLARVDFAKYRSGAATMRNFFVDYRSGASTRPGTEFIRPTVQGQGAVRLVRFQQSVDVTYALEFGNQYLRFVSNGSSIVEPPGTVTAISRSNPAIVTVPTHNFNTGDLIFISDIDGMLQADNRYFIVNVFPGTGTFSLIDPLTLHPVDSTNWLPMTGPGLAARVYTLPTPYLQAELSLLKFSQNAAVMNITHPNHPPYKLQLINATNWVLTPAVFGATVGSPTGITTISTNPGSASYKYTVTAMDANGQEGVNGTVNVLTDVRDLRVEAGSNIIQWSAVPGAASYNIYGSPASYAPLTADTGGLGFIGSVNSSITTFFDSNISADFAQTPPIHDNPFVGVNPQVSSYFQQRLVYANGGGQLVATFWASKTGASYNFDISNPSQANDAITAELVSLEVNEIKSMIPMPTGLIMMTTHGAWIVNGGAGGVASQGGPITPQTVTATPQAYIGANDVPPILINYDILFIQQKGSIVRDLTFNIYANIYTGNDISILSSHLFYDHQILEWAYAEEPFKVIWCIREDGVLLGLTVVKEQDMYGWSRHDTRGKFKSICTVTEGTTDATYVVVERHTATGLATMIERIANREFHFGAEDSWCVDCGVRTIANTPDARLFMGFVDPATLQFAATAAVFTPNMVGWVLRAKDGIAKITEVTAEGVVVGHIRRPFTLNRTSDDPDHRFLPVDPGDWSIDPEITQVFGLDHLEGQKVSVLADGGVVNDLVVHDASITIPNPASKVIVGYGFQAQLQTMPLDLGNEINSVQGKRKKVAALTVRCKDSRGVKAGMTFGTVTPIKEMNRVTLMGLPISLVTADERIVMDPLWDVPGQICIQVDDPLPSTVLGVIPEVVVGDSQK